MERPHENMLRYVLSTLCILVLMLSKGIDAYLEDQVSADLCQ
jgi:hypothetical protein